MGIVRAPEEGTFFLMCDGSQIPGVSCGRRTEDIPKTTREEEAILIAKQCGWRQVRLNGWLQLKCPNHWAVERISRIGVY